MRSPGFKPLLPLEATGAAPGAPGQVQCATCHDPHIRELDAAKGNRWGHRDATMVLIAYRHGLRASEIVNLEWSQVDFTHAVLHVRRAKKGTPATHPLQVAAEAQATQAIQHGLADTVGTGLHTRLSGRLGQEPDQPHQA